MDMVSFDDAPNSAGDEHILYKMQFERTNYAR